MAYVQKKIVNSNTLGTSHNATFDSNTTSGNGIAVVLLVRADNTTTDPVVTVADNKSNTWALVGEAGAPSAVGVRTEVWKCQDITTGGASHQVQVTSSNNMRVVIAAFECTDPATALGNTNTGTGGASATSGTVAAGGAGEAFAGFAQNQWELIGNLWSGATQEYEQENPATNAAGSVLSKTFSGASTEGATWDIDTTIGWAAAIIFFPNAGGGGDVTPPTLTSATTTHNEVSLQFDETVNNVSGSPTVKVDGSTVAHTMSGSGATRTLTRDSGTTSRHSSVTVSIPAGMVEDTSGNDIAAVTDFAVTNNSTKYIRAVPFTLSADVSMSAVTEFTITGTGAITGNAHSFLLGGVTGLVSIPATVDVNGMGDSSNYWIECTFTGTDGEIQIHCDTDNCGAEHYVRTSNFGKGSRSGRSTNCQTNASATADTGTLMLFEGLNADGTRFFEINNFQSDEGWIKWDNAKPFRMGPSTDFGSGQVVLSGDRGGVWFEDNLDGSSIRNVAAMTTSPPAWSQIPCFRFVNPSGTFTAHNVTGSKGHWISQGMYGTWRRFVLVDFDGHQSIIDPQLTDAEYGIIGYGTGTSAGGSSDFRYTSSTVTGSVFKHITSVGRSTMTAPPVTIENTSADPSLIDWLFIDPYYNGGNGNFTIRPAHGQTTTGPADFPGRLTDEHHNALAHPSSGSGFGIGGVGATGTQGTGNITTATGVSSVTSVPDRANVINGTVTVTEYIDAWFNAVRPTSSSNLKNADSAGTGTIGAAQAPLGGVPSMKSSGRLSSLILCGGGMN